MERMHRLIEDHLEELLNGTLKADHPAEAHLRGCGNCREAVAAMRDFGAVLRTMGPDREAEPRPGFYARVVETIERQRPVSIWAWFSESAWGRQLATASLAFALVTGVVAVAMDDEPAVLAQSAELDPLYPGAGFGSELLASDRSDNGVFLSLASYREH
jgi:predicted anti-sigma-YlaC factor YlaD